LAVIVVLTIAILPVVVRVTLIGSILLRILLRVLLWVLLLPERNRFQASREHYDCDPVAFHYYSSLRNAPLEQLEHDERMHFAGRI
jgi:hypothetical protein